MRIGIMCHATCGGSGRIAVESAKELSRYGHEVHLFTRTPSYFFPGTTDRIVCHTMHRGDREEGPTFLRNEWPVGEYDIFTNLVSSVIKERQIDILHVHYGLPFVFIAGRIQEELGRVAPSVVVTLHGTDENLFAENNEKSKEFSRVLSGVQALTTVSRRHAELLAELSGRSWNVEIIPDFVDLRCFRPSGSSHIPSKPLFVHVSNFRSVKHLGGTFEIFADIAEKIDARLLMVGDGEEMGRARELVQQRGLREKVVFSGLVSNVSEIMGKAQFLVLSSVYESFCVAALEAMACGLPVIAPRVGGLPEVVIHNKTGFLFEPGDYAAGADYAVKLLSAPDLYGKARADAAEHAGGFDGRDIVRRYEALYLKIVAGRR